MKLKNYIMFAVMLAVGMSFMSCGSKKDKTSQVKYETQIVKADTLTYNVFIPAALHGVHEVEVYPQVEGIIRKVNFTDGVKVSKGQVLFVIDQTEAKLQVQNAQANLAAARAQMETTKLRYESNKQLASKKIVSQYVMSTSLNAYHVAQAAVEQVNLRAADQGPFTLGQELDALGRGVRALVKLTGQEFHREHCGGAFRVKLLHGIVQLGLREHFPYRQRKHLIGNVLRVIAVQQADLLQALDAQEFYHVIFQAAGFIVQAGFLLNKDSVNHMYLFYLSFTMQ